MQFECRKLSKCHLKGNTCKKWANGLKLRGRSGLSAPAPGQFTCILYMYQGSSSLKPLGQSNLNLIRSIYNKGSQCVFKPRSQDQGGRHAHI